MTIAQQVGPALLRASVCLGSLQPADQVQLAAKMQTAADALEDSSAVPWYTLWANRAERCQELAAGGAHDQLIYRQWCLPWQDALVLALQDLAAFLRLVGCADAAEVVDSAAEGTAAEGEQAAEVLPSLGNLELPGIVKVGLGAGVGLLLLVLVLKP